MQFAVASNGCCSTYGNGTHASIVENTDYVFADYDDGELELTHAFPIQVGTATLTLSVVPDEHPPVAEHDLASIEACDDASVRR